MTAGAEKEGTMAKRNVNGKGSLTYLEDKKLYMYRYSFEGKRKAFYGKTEKECYDKFRAFDKSLITRGTKITTKTTVGEYYKHFMDLRRNEIQGTSFATYPAVAYTLKDLDCGIYDMQIKNVTKKHTEMMMSELCRRFKYKVVEKYRTYLTMMFKRAIKEGYIKENPMKDIKIYESSCKPTRERTFLSKEEISKISDYADSNEKWSEAAKILLFVVHTGLRRGELCGLKWKHIRNGYVYVEEIVVLAQEFDSDFNSLGNKLWEKKPKSKSSVRSIPLDEKATEILGYFAQTPHTKEDYVFVFREGRCCGRNVKYSTMPYFIEQVCKSADIRNVTVHELRHTFGSQLIAEGADIGIVSKLMGHSDISVTYRVYIHFSDYQYTNAINLLNAL